MPDVGYQTIQSSHNISLSDSILQLQHSNPHELDAAMERNGGDYGQQETEAAARRTAGRGGAA
jgi:hypothetical protein